MSATIKYKGNTIASITTDSSKTLKTSGKYCEGDIVVENVQDGGGGGKATIETFCTDNIANQFLCDTWSPSTSAKLFKPGKYSYNGVVLPGFPANVMAGYPYAFIHKGSTRYSLVFSKYPYYFTAATDDKPDRLVADTGGQVNYLLNYADLESATEWSYRNDSWYYWELNEGLSILWSNYDIPNGSATATEIYFEGSEPVLVEASDN